MSDELALIGIAVVCTVAYMMAGLGVARAVSIIKARPLRMFELFFWPIVLGCLAAVGDID
jgi:hypothetical protein